MFTRKLQMPQHGMPTAEEFALWGARELSFEELLAVNGGRHVIDDPSTDDVSDTIANGGSSPGGSSSSSNSGGSSDGSSGSTGGSSGNSDSSGGSSGTNDSSPPASSSPSEPVTGGNSDDTGGGYTDYWEGACTDWYESGGSSGGGSSNGSSGSSDNHSSDSGNADSGSSDDSWGGSSDNDSSDSGGSYTGGSYTGGGYTYTPPVQNQEPSAPDSPDAQGQELPNTGGMPSVPQQPDVQAPANPEPKKGWGEKIRDWFDGRKEDVVGSIKERFSRGSRDGAGERRNGLPGQENIKSVSSDGTWVNNGDATFTARKKATLSGLRQLTGKDWRESNWDKKRDPRTLQVGETVDMGRRTSMPTGVPLINNNEEAEYLYNNGNGTKAWLGDDVYKALREKNAQKENKIQSGNTLLAEGNYGIILSGKNLLFGKDSIYDKNGMFFMGNTQIKYKISTGTEFCVVDFTASDGDGFWDIYDFRNNSPKADGIGPNLERNGSFPYAFYPRTWSISFPVPNNKKW